MDVLTFIETIIIKLIQMTKLQKILYQRASSKYDILKDIAIFICMQLIQHFICTKFTSTKHHALNQVTIGPGQVHVH